MYTPNEQADGEDLRAAVVQTLLLAGRRWRTRLNERLKAIGQTDARFFALSEIATCREGVVQRELSHRLGVEEPTVVRLLDALQAAGWVERQVHLKDRRAKVVRATPAAKRVLTDGEAIVGELQHDLFDGVCAHDVAVCLQVLGVVSQRLGRPA